MPKAIKIFFLVPESKTYVFIARICLNYYLVLVESVFADEAATGLLASCNDFT